METTGGKISPCPRMPCPRGVGRSYKIRRDNVREFPTGILTLLFTDIEGSTRLLQQLGDRYADVLKECRRLLRMAFQQGNGYEVDTQGDAFFVVFERAA